MKRLSLLVLLLALSQPACVVVGGYSSSDGWFLWPGALGLLLMIAFVFLLARRRR